MNDANGPVTLRHPPGCQSKRTPEGGYAVTAPEMQTIGLDKRLGRLWEMADGVTMETLGRQVEDDYPQWQEAIRALRLAGLLLPPLARRWEPSPLPDPAPLVSVIIPTRNGRHHLAECLPSIEAQSYPRVEIVVVDDASTDGTVEYLQIQFPDVKVVPFAGGPNFSASCNLGARHATGDYLFFLNNDTVLDEHCIRELVVAAQDAAQNAAREDGDVGGVAAMMRFYHAPAFINGLGTAQRRLGFGYDVGIGSLDVGQFDDVDQVPALCFGAALIPRTAWQEVGPLDERYQFYYEDADWSYRARLLGLRLVPAPHALVFHKFSASMSEKSSAFKVRLATRNRLWYVVKNFPAGAALLQMALYWLDDWSRLAQSLVRGRWSVAGAIPRAWLGFYIGLPGVLRARWRLSRKKPVNLAGQEGTLPPPAGASETPILAEEMITNRYRPHLQRMGGDNGPQRRRLLIISPDAVHSRMGGVGIRYWELARQLAGVADVTLAVPRETDLESDRIAIRPYQEGVAASLRPLAKAADVILLSGFTVYHHPFLCEIAAYKIVDLYDPMILENLERFADKPMAERRGLHNVGVNTFNELFMLGDFFICASEKQRDYWLGALTAANRVNPLVYEEDPTLKQLIDLVPFGLPAKPPQQTRAVLKGVWPGIGPEDKVILWGGGLWDWLDPLTVIDAMPAVLDAVPGARLFFLGTRHPNPDVPIPAMAQRAIDRAEALGLKDEAVFFNDWTPYQERVDYLCEADVGVSLHGDHIETRFAVRTRLMDYLWARLPMVVGGGDVLSDLVDRHELGHVVAAGDEAAVANALIDLLRNPVPADRFGPVTARFHWERAAAPLKVYMQRPWTNAGGGQAETDQSVSTATPLRQLPAKALALLREQGISGLVREMTAYVRWLQQN